MEEVYLLTVMVLHAMLCAVWSKQGAFNLLVKASFAGLVVWGVLVWLAE